MDWQRIPDTVLTTAPGVLVALLSYWLTLVRQQRERRQANANARLALILEMRANRATLATFWGEINALDSAGKETLSEEHLAGMAYGGLLRYRLPGWDRGRWERFPAQALGTLTAKEIGVVDQTYRDLRVIRELYSDLLALESEERAELNTDRFWYNRFAGWRLVTWRLLVPLVERVLGSDLLQ